MKRVSLNTKKVSKRTIKLSVEIQRYEKKKKGLHNKIFDYKSGKFKDIS